MSQSSWSRRRFVTCAAGLGASLALPQTLGATSRAMGQSVKGRSTGSKLRIALIGVGGRGGAHHNWANKESVVALCDADTRMFDRRTWYQNNRPGSEPAKRWSNAALYDDYRQLFENPDTFDAVVISTPDHTHFAAASKAIKLGKHVFCEKPLTWSVQESLELARLTRENQVVTQMGNQGMGSNGWRKCYSYYHAGLIGQVHTVHAWSPIQGSGEYGVAARAKPQGKDAIPDSLNWDAWIGAAPMRPYVQDAYHVQKWRQVVDFGNGILGDWCCHKLNAVFKTLEPGMPTHVENKHIVEFNGESWPLSRVIKWVFPKGEVNGKSRDAFELFWHDGHAKPVHDDLPDWPKDRPIPDHGVVLMGEKGSIHVHGSHNGNASLLPLSLDEQHGDLPLMTEPARDHFQEFVDAAKGQLAWDAPLSNFMYGGHMTAVSLLGNVSLVQGNPLEIDSETGQVKHLPQSILGRQARKGWEL